MINKIDLFAIRDNVDIFLGKEYLETQNCTDLKKQIDNIQLDIDFLNKNLWGTREGFVSNIMIDAIRRKMRDIVLKKLKIILLSKKNIYDLGNCAVIPNNTLGVIQNGNISNAESNLNMVPPLSNALGIVPSEKTIKKVKIGLIGLAALIIGGIIYKLTIKT